MGEERPVRARPRVPLLSPRQGRAAEQLQALTPALRAGDVRRFSDGAVHARQLVPVRAPWREPDGRIRFMAPPAGTASRAATIGLRRLPNGAVPAGQRVPVRAPGGRRLLDAAAVAVHGPGRRLAVALTRMRMHSRAAARPCLENLRMENCTTRRRTRCARGGDHRCADGDSIVTAYHAPWEVCPWQTCSWGK